MFNTDWREKENKILNEAGVINFYNRGVFSNFERAQSARSRIVENIELVKIYCRPSDVFGLPICLMRHLILVFTNFQYMKIKNEGQYLILINILPDYLFSKHRRVQRRPITALVSISARGHFCYSWGPFHQTYQLQIWSSLPWKRGKQLQIRSYSVSQNGGLADEAHVT